MTTYFSDDFSVAGNPPPNNWVPEGYWQVENGHMTDGDYGIAGWCYHASGTTSLDYTVSAVLLTPASPTNQQGVIARHTQATPSTHYEAVLHWGTAGTGTLQLRKLYGGADTLIVEDTSVNLVTGPHTLSLNVNGTLITVSLDGTVRLTATDGSITTGSNVGVSQGTTSGKQLYFDSFSQTSLPPTMTISPSTVPWGPTAVRVYLYGSNTSWTAGIPGSPTFTVDQGTIASQQVIAANLAAIDYQTPLEAVTATFTDPTSSASAQLAVVAPAGSPPAVTDWPSLQAWLQWLVNFLINRFFGIDIVLGFLGEGSQIPYVQRIIDEMGITADSTPTNGILRQAFAQLTVDTASPPSVNHLLNALYPDVPNILTAIHSITNNGQYTLSDVLTAIGNISTAGVTEQDLDDLLGELQGSVATTLYQLATTLAAIQTVHNYTLGDVVSLLPDQATILNAITAAQGTDLGGSHPTIHDVRADVAGEKASLLAADGALAAGIIACLLLGAGTTAEETIAVVESTLADGLSVADVVGLIASFLTQHSGTTQQTVIDLSTVLQDLANLSSDLAADDVAIDAAIDGAVTDINSHTDTALSQLRLPAAQSFWPGLDNVNLGSAFYFVGDATITAQMDGALIRLSAYPTSRKSWQVGTVVNLERAGFFAFISDQGDVDERQPLAWNSAVALPRTMLHASKLVIHAVDGVEGTVYPWTLA